MDVRTEFLIDILDHAFDKRSFHGTTLRGALRGLDTETALWRPAPDRHNVWEYLLHAAYWKYIVRRHLVADPPSKFGRSPSNWPAVPAQATPKDLKHDIVFLRDEHAALRSAVEAFPGKRLDTTAGKGLTYRSLIQGVAAHDLYHTGQIQLLKKLAPARTR